jgi:mono/diheme cytochrome c family protein
LKLYTLLIVAWLGGFQAHSTEPTHIDQGDLPEKAIAILRTRCIACHGADKSEGGLRLDSRENLLVGGDGGEVLQAGKARESRLVESLRSTDPDSHMPPKESLTESEISTVERWIALGAKWPAAGNSNMQASDGTATGNAWEDANNPIRKLFRGERLDLWSLRPVVRPVVRVVQRISWPLNPLDCFVLAQWEREPVSSIAPDASPRKLALRVSMDLTGLPPSFEQVEQLSASHDPLAYDRWVDGLLSEPSYGVRWARMWLDVVRYSDSNGFDWDEFRPQAWRFRDYVVDAWNRDLPFDQFTLEQLAGDELVGGPPKNFDERQQLVATGYLRVGPQDNSSALFDEQERSRAQLLADLTETTGSAFLGLTMSCCRCHDHKTDPLSHADHFRMRAFFAPVQYADDLPLDLPERRHEIEQHNAEIDKQASVIDEQIAAVLVGARARLKPTEVGVKAGAELKNRSASEQVAEQGNDAKEKQNEKTELTEEEVKKQFTADENKLAEDLGKRKKELQEQKLKYTHGLLMRDKATDVPATFVLFQGDHKSPRASVGPGFPSVLDPREADILSVSNDSTGRRTTLAKWIASSKNPWTARVVVNRLWQSHFGEGLVATPNDFGITGARPKYPELLDWLASELIDSDWSIKHVQRLIVTSRVYRQATASDPRGPKSLRASLRRLEAEALRDRILTASGLMNARMGGPPVWPEIPAEVLQANPAFLDDNETKTKGWYPSPTHEQSVRSLYLVQKRTVRIPFMETFDLPDNSVSCARREASLVAPQALTLLNGTEIELASLAMAEYIRAHFGSQRSEQVEAVFQLALLRKPTANERAIAEGFLAHRSLPELCRAMLNTNEFAFLE